MRDFKIDLILYLQDRILSDLSIDLINTATSVTRVQVSLNYGGGYRQLYAVATYDIKGTHLGEGYHIRFYAYLDKRKHVERKTIDTSAQPELKGIYAYNLFLYEPDLVDYRLRKRFPIIGNCPIGPRCFCEYTPDKGALVDLNGDPLCPKAGFIPTITLIGDNPLELLDTDAYTEYGATAFDPEDGDLSASIQITVPDDIGDVGTHIVNYSVTDHDGNTETIRRTVNVIHINNPPTIQLNAINGQFSNFTIPWGSEFVDTGATATDSEDGDLTDIIQVSGDPVDTLHDGSYTITYTVTDNNGDSNSVERVVTVGHNTQPNVTLVGDDVIEVIVGDPWNDPGAEAFDLEDGNITDDIEVTGEVVNDTLGDYVITYRVSDRGGRSHSVERTVKIIPNPLTPPTLTLLGPNPLTMGLSEHKKVRWFKVLGYASNYGSSGYKTALANIELIDTEGRNILEAPYTCYPPYYEDDCQAAFDGNVDTDGTIGTHDTLSQVGFQAKGDMTHDIAYLRLTAPKHISSHHNPPNREVKLVYIDTEGDIPVASASWITISDLGNPTWIEGEVKVFPLDFSVPLNEKYVDPGYTAYDEQDGDLTDQVVVAGDVVDRYTPGTYNVIYTVTDSHGASITKTRSVTINNSEPPVIVLQGDNPVEMDQLPDKKVRWFKIFGASHEWGAHTHRTVLSKIELLDIHGNNVLEAPYTCYPEVGNDLHVASFDGNSNTDGSLSTTGSLSEVGWVAKSSMIADLDVLKLTASMTIEDDYNPPDTKLRLGYKDLDEGEIPEPHLGWTIIDTFGSAQYVPGETVWTPGEEKTFDINFNLALNQLFVDPGYTATDPEDGDITDDVIISGDFIDLYTAGTYNRIYTVTDGAGISVSRTREVIIHEVSVPVITLLGDNPYRITANILNGDHHYTTSYIRPLGATFNDPQVRDFSDPDAALAEFEAMHFYTTDGTTSSSYFKDTSGNQYATYAAYSAANPDTPIVNMYCVVANGEVEYTKSTILYLDQDRTYHVIQKNYMPPLAIMNANYNTATEAVDAVANAIGPGTYAIMRPSATWPDTVIDMVDSSGNIIVAEAVELRWDVVGANPYVDPGYTATDAVDGDLTGDVTVLGDDNIDVTEPNNYVVTYSVTNSSGKNTGKGRQVVIEENHPPTITLNGDNPMTLTEIFSYNEPGATVTDVEDGDLTSSMVVSPPILGVFGTWNVYYTVMDSHGLSTTVVRVINIQALNQPPTITILGDNPITLTEGDDWVDPGATAYDPEDGDITASIQLSGDTVDTSTAGTYNVTYTASDNNGASVSANREVIVEEAVTDTYPVITPVAPIISGAVSNVIFIDSGDEYVEQGATATDAEDGDITGSITMINSDTGPWHIGDVIADDSALEGTIIIHYNVTDSDGNITSLTRGILITYANLEIVLEEDDNGDDYECTTVQGTPWSEPGADIETWEPAPGSVVIAGDTVDENAAVGTVFTITYNYTDSEGNEAEEVTRTVEIIA